MSSTKNSTNLFRQKVLRIVSRIPKGKVLSYQAVAERAGSPRASRAVGTILKGNWNKNIPCHRVVRSDGTSGAYNRGASAKILRLKKEGVIFRNGKIYASR